jgi:signal transduction histidine kinase
LRTSRSFWLLFLAVFVPGSVLIAQQWMLGGNLARLQTQEQLGRVRRAVDRFVTESMAAFREENQQLYQRLMRPIPLEDVQAGRIPAGFLPFAEVRREHGRPMVLFTALPVGDTFVVNYFALGEDDEIHAFAQKGVIASHRAVLTYIHSVAGTEEFHTRLFAESFFASTERSPLGPVHFFHVPIYRDAPFMPQAYAGWWETVNFAFRAFLAPRLEAGKLADELRAEDLDPDALVIDVRGEFGERLYGADTAEDLVEPLLEVRLSSYGPLFEPCSLRVGMIRGAPISPRAALWKQNALLLGLAAALLAIGGVLLARSIARDRWLARMHTDFVARVSHELKTPVAVLLNAAETMANPKVNDPADQARCTAIVHERVRDLARLLDRLLDVCRIDADVLPVARRAVDMPAYLRRTVPRLCEGVGLPMSRVSLDFNGDAPAVVQADEAALDLVLRNLLENVVKHAGDGPVVVTCAADDRSVTVTVADSGPGVPRGEEKRIFRKFYRVEDSMRSAAPGHGLGLALVKALVEAHGGRIGVTPGPTGGAAFYFRLAKEHSR